MGKVKITIIDKNDITDNQKQCLDEEIRSNSTNENNSDNNSDNGNNDNNDANISNDNNVNNNKRKWTRIIIAVIVIIFFGNVFKNQLLTSKDEEALLYSDISKSISEDTLASNKRPSRLLDKDLDLWADTYGSSTYLLKYLTYNDKIEFMSDILQNKYDVICDLKLYDSYLNRKDNIDKIIEKLNGRGYFNKKAIVEDLNNSDEIYVINKDRIVSVKEIEDKITKKSYLEITLPNNTICKTKLKYRDELRDKLDNNELFDKDFEKLKEIINNNKNDVLNGVILYDNPEKTMLYLYRNQVGITQSLISVFDDNQKENFFGKIGNTIGDIINIDDRIIINPKLIKSVKYDKSYVSINLDGGYNSLIENIKISSEGKDKLNNIIDEYQIELISDNEKKILTTEDSKVVAKYSENLYKYKENYNEDDELYYMQEYKRLQKILNNHKNDILNAVRISEYDFIIYYFKNSDGEVGVILFKFSTSKKMQFFFDIEKFMGDILILDDKVLLNPRLIREVIYQAPYTTILLDGGLNSKLENLELSQNAIKELIEWAKEHNIKYN